MSIIGNRITVGTTATLIAKSAPGASSVLVKNITGTVPIFLGGPNVTTATGYQWDVGDGPVSADMPSGALYGIVAATPQTVHYLAST